MPEPRLAPPVGWRPGPEFRLLADCSWRPEGPKAQEQATRIQERLAGGIHWETFIRLVDRHRVASLVCPFLARPGGGLIPEPAQAALLGRARKDSVNALRHAAELVRVKQGLAGQGIEVLPLKGPLLSQRLYGEPACRSLHDLDLLIHPGDLGRTDAWLLEQGYHRLEPEGSSSPRMIAAHMARTHHFVYRQDAGNLQLEMHWRFHDWQPEQVRQFWALSAERPALGASFLQPEDDALLILLCDHGAAHRWFRLKWLSDVAMLLARKPPETWATTLERAGTFQAEPALAQAVLLCHWLYGVEVPAAAQTLLREVPAAEWLACRALEALGTYLGPGPAREEPGNIPGGHSLSQAWIDYRYKHQIKPAYSLFQHLARVAIAPVDAEILPLPERWYFLYYFLRPVLWLWRRVSSRSRLSSR